MEGIVSTSEGSTPTDERSTSEKLADRDSDGTRTGETTATETPVEQTDGNESTSSTDGDGDGAPETTSETPDASSDGDGDGDGKTPTKQEDTKKSSSGNGKAKTRAEKYAEAAEREAKAKPPKASTPKAPGKKEARYAKAPWLKAAVKAARELSGCKKDGEGKPKGDMTVEYAGPIQHELVRRVVTEYATKPSKRPDWVKNLLGDKAVEVNPDSVLKISGIKTQKLLRSIAIWEAESAAMKPLATLAAEMKTEGGKVDSWARGRYLAAILSVWIDEMKAEAAASRRSASKPAKAKEPVAA